MIEIGSTEAKICNGIYLVFCFDMVLACVSVLDLTPGGVRFNENPVDGEFFHHSQILLLSQRAPVEPDVVTEAHQLLRLLKSPIEAVDNATSLHFVLVSLRSGHLLNFFLFPF